MKRKNEVVYFFFRVRMFSCICWSTPEYGWLNRYPIGCEMGETRCDLQPFGLVQFVVFIIVVVGWLYISSVTAFHLVWLFPSFYLSTRKGWYTETNAFKAWNWAIFALKTPTYRFSIWLSFHFFLFHQTHPFPLSIRIQSTGKYSMKPEIYIGQCKHQQIFY